MEPNPYEAPTAPVKRGHGRRIVGWIIFSLAALLTARVAWFALTAPEIVYEETSNRVLVLGTIGVVMMGCGVILLCSARRAARRSEVS